MSVRSGLDVFLKKRGGRRRGARAGFITHQASVTRDLRPSVEALEAAGLKIAALFAPEHGLAGTAQDQIPVASEGDARRPVHSLYGEAREQLAPSAQSLEGLDYLLFDLQDVGTRYYTFVWTMTLAMKAAAKAGLPFVVLDRPNPLGGDALEGNVLDPAYASFVGLYPVPVRHGLTAGELARFVNERFSLGCDLEVAAMEGWKRKMWHDETGLPWVMPSPNMPTLDTAAVYAGMCLLEATNLSEGRGTTRPFELSGAPFVDGAALARALEQARLPGAAFRPVSFRPTFHKFAGETCGGVQIHVADRKTFRPYLTGLAYLQAVKRLWPDRFAWRKPPYEYETVKMPIDILCGTDRVRKAIDADTDVARLSKEWEPELKVFRKDRAAYLLY